MTRVFFVRHAEPNYENHDDMLRELSPRGMEDRKLVTAFLSDKKIDVVLSSPFKRAVDTVADFAEKNKLTIETIDDFRVLKTEPHLFENLQIDESRTCIYWNDRVDLPSDTLLEYGKRIQQAV